MRHESGNASGCFGSFDCDRESWCPLSSARASSSGRSVAPDPDGAASRRRRRTVNSDHPGPCCGLPPLHGDRRRSSLRPVLREREARLVRPADGRDAKNPARVRVGGGPLRRVRHRGFKAHDVARPRSSTARDSVPGRSATSSRRSRAGRRSCGGTLDQCRPAPASCGACPPDPMPWPACRAIGLHLGIGRPSPRPCLRPKAHSAPTCLDRLGSATTAEPPPPEAGTAFPLSPLCAELRARRSPSSTRARERLRTTRFWSHPIAIRVRLHGGRHVRASLHRV
jgi:hypothetical protein